ncbi:MAG: FecR domain-containing protein [Methylovulum sp.]|nr:FecR domain-containing protein [Methylovulum sp.]
MRTQLSERVKTYGLLFLLGSMTQPLYAQSQVVGKISFARGSNAAQQPGAAPRILGAGTEIFQGDNIQTTERSFVIIDFIDGTKVTVRPNSNFSIDHYELQAGTPKAQLALHEGGIHTSNGAIAGHNPEDFQIKTDLATVKAQQADYSVRICRDDCQQEQAQQTTTEAGSTAPDVVARVVEIKGDVYADNPEEIGTIKERRLSLGSPLYSKDHLQSKKDSYALMVFRDGEKITLQADSKMEIARYSYQHKSEKDQALYRLTTGGMRVLTGTIGKTNKEAFAIDTPVGTIGIRGTGFDLTCVGTCINNQPTTPEQIQQGRMAGLYSHVWEGQIALLNDTGEHLLSMPDSNYIASRNADAWTLPGLPPALFNLPIPRPDADHSNLQKLFSATRQKTVPAGLYVAVHKGRVQLNQEGHSTRKNTNINLGKDEAGYVDPKKGIGRLAKQQDFQTRDPYQSDNGHAKHPDYQDIDSINAEGYETNSSNAPQCDND